MRHRWIRRAAYGLGALATVVAALVVAVYTVTSARLRRTFDVPLTEVAVAGDSATLARGEHLVRTIGKCGDCHGADLGGRLFIDGGPGRVIATNLTRGGAAGRYTTAELERAIRHGVRRDGRGLMVMPSDEFNALSDADVGAIIAYLRSVPAVSRDLPRSELFFLGRALWMAGKLPVYAADAIDHAKRPPARVAAGPTVAYGHYLAHVGGCTGCHGANLSGGHVPGTPPEWKPAANLTPTGIGRWTAADFTRALREGKRPDGTPIDTVMPWRASGAMTDTEITAVYAYLRTVPPRTSGTR